ncbi:MAG: DnaD domain protein [Lachnospiraceae bacterium]|nr:DnaD domain protein [Lachnospiraceae bacterium]
MGRVSINREQVPETDTTAVSNVFIDKYMTQANDAQLKIYLYLLRMMRAGLPTSLSDLADRFNLTEKDVTRALKFWEKRGILSMEYDSDKKLSGIHVEDLSSHETVGETAPSAHTADAEDDFPEDTQAPAPVFKTPGKTDSDCSQLLFIAEQYLGRPLSVADTRSLLYIHDNLQFSDALLDYLLQYCVERGKKDFRYMERVAVRWRESGYETPEQARRGSFKYDKRIYEIMDLLGLNNLPTATEAEFVNRWICEYHMPIDIIREACARTVRATQKHRLEYADKILLNWHQAGVSRKNDIRQLDEMHEGRKKASAESAPAAGSTSAGGARNTRIHNFPERNYDFSLLEKQLVQN